MAGKPHAPRNYVLEGGITRYSRSAMYKRKALYKKKKVAVKAAKAKDTYFKRKEVKGEKNGEKRFILAKKSPRYYPTEDVPRKLLSRKKPKPARLRTNITPGTVLILLAGRHMGKRVVFLRQLSSGLLMVTGPFSMNGVPLRRVNQAYVVSTKTKLDISGIDIPQKFDDDYFRRSKPKTKKGGGSIFSESKQAYTLSDTKKEDQKELDGKIMPAIKSVPSLKQYLARRFSLSRGQFPHKMIF